MNKINAIITKLHKFHWFIIGVTLFKIVLMGLFSSDYQNKMFMPFVDQFVTSLSQGFFNPYEYYYMNNMAVAFPYPPLMLYIESIGGVILQLLGDIPLFFKNIIFKLPNMFFDFVGLYYLMRLYPQRRKYIGILYFASPIILYATYMHGQLDIIPTALLIGSIYYLTSKEPFYDGLFVLFLSGALLTKLHILAVVPILFIYILKKHGLKLAVKLMMFTVSVTVIGMLPFLGMGFIESVLFNNEQRLLTQVSFDFVNTKIYLPILAILFIYLQEFALSNINKELLLSFCSVLFTVFLALIPPMPGWYVWIVPFVTVFFINVNDSKDTNFCTYLMLNGLYVLYFICFHTTAYVDLYFLSMDLSIFKYHNEMLRNVIFTLLSGLLIYSAIVMYRLGITSNSLYKRKDLPFTIGIAGDSGTGKSTFISRIEMILGEKKILFIEGDGDHKWERGEKMWEEYTHLNPKANYLYRQAMDIQTLRKGRAVHRVDYDHGTGKFSSERKIKPNKYIILCGLHSFYLPQMRRVLDLKIYMDADENLRRYWKIQRDTAKRGYTKDKIIEQIEGRIDDTAKYITPQREYADLVVQYFDKNLTDCCVDNHEVIMSLKLTLSSEINIEPIIEALNHYHIDSWYDYSDNLRKQIIVFDGASIINSTIPFLCIANQIIPQLDEITTQELDSDDNIAGIINLFLLMLISNKMRGEIL